VKIVRFEIRIAILGYLQVLSLYPTGDKLINPMVARWWQLKPFFFHPENWGR